MYSNQPAYWLGSLNNSEGHPQAFMEILCKRVAGCHTSSSHERAALFCLF